MLNPFPDLLALGFIAPTLLRLVVAVGFGGMAWAHYSRRSELSNLGMWLWLAIVLEIVIAVSLALGMYTQLGALGALILSVACAVYAKKYPRLVPMCRGEYILLAIISLSLMLSGGGAFAQDLPL
jgi:uncharacterized membrane protein YphA (DoxX/SURF4 family)